LWSEGLNLEDQKKACGVLMSTKRQQGRIGRGGQAKRPGRPVSRHAPGGADAIESAGSEESPKLAANGETELLTQQLMERVADSINMNRAYQRVVSNKGAAGVDGMAVNELREWIHENKERLLTSLLTGEYKPEPVRGVQIPKVSGGVRQLGIPTVVDRMVQQAMAQVLEPILDPQFSESSYGFRPGRGAHDALRQAAKYVEDGRIYVVDIDLEKFFDRVNHDILMSRLARHVKDKRFLRITRAFLNAGLMQDGVCIRREEGTPQGGPLSPILSNLLLDDLDKELECRNHKFCRYADDCNIYVYSQAAGERVMTSVTRFLEKKLKLKVNASKSAVGLCYTRKFLGYHLGRGGTLHVSPESLNRFKNRIRLLTRRNQSKAFEQIIERLNSYLNGWFAYYRYGCRPSLLARLDEWIRRKLRCYRLKQCKRTISVSRFLQSLGVPAWQSWLLAKSGKGWWRLSLAIASAMAMNLAWFRKMGLVALSAKAVTVKI
jgi:RNA-directed DNA polymerase